MNLIRSISLVLTSFLFASCATPALWDATDPHEYVAIPKSKVNEDELKAKGISYRVFYEQNLFLVEKTELQKYKDYTYRALR